MDLIDRIKDSVNTLNLPVKLTKGVLMAGKESLVIYPLAGSKVSQSYMDGAKDANINLEIAMSSKDGSLLENTLWQVQDYLDMLDDVPSADGSYQFNHIEVTSKPYIAKLDETGWLVFMLTFQVNVTTKEEKSKWHKN